MVYGHQTNFLTNRTLGDDHTQRQNEAKAGYIIKSKIRCHSASMLSPLVRPPWKLLKLKLLIRGATVQSQVIQNFFKGSRLIGSKGFWRPRGGKQMVPMVPPGMSASLVQRWVPPSARMRSSDVMRRRMMIRSMMMAIIRIISCEMGLTLSKS